MEVVAARLLPPTIFQVGERVRMERCSCYGGETKVAGVIRKVEVSVPSPAADGDALRRPVGLGAAKPPQLLRAHLCQAACNQEEVADDLVHCLEVRKMDEPNKEDGWASNMIPVDLPADDLAALRGREREVLSKAAEDPGGRGHPPVEKPGDAKESADKEDKKKKSKKKKKKKKSSSTSSSSSSVDILSGKKSKIANLKEPSALFGGTGLDPVESVRRRVAKRAKAYLRKKGRESASSEDEDAVDKTLKEAKDPWKVCSRTRPRCVWLQNNFQAPLPVRP